GGVLVQPTNRGHYSDDRLAFLPELAVLGSWDPTTWLRLTVGYNFLYLSGASRAARLIDSVDSRQVPQLNSYNPAAVDARPAVNEDHSGVWAQGLTAGVEFRY